MPADVRCSVRRSQIARIQRAFVRCKSCRTAYDFSVLFKFIFALLRFALVNLAVEHQTAPCKQIARIQRLAYTMHSSESSVNMSSPKRLIKILQLPEGAHCAKNLGFSLGIWALPLCPNSGPARSADLAESALLFSPRVSAT